MVLGNNKKQTLPQIQRLMKYKHYDIMPVKTVPEMKGCWDGDIWRQANTLTVDCFRPEGSGHQPQTFCRLLYNEQNIFGIFRVEDQYVRCVQTGFQADVWKDSCVEFFVQPEKSAGYFNFEFNCGGALLTSYVKDPTRIDGRLQSYIPLTPEDDQQIRRYAGLPPMVEPEVVTPLVWMLEFSIPFRILEKYAGVIGEIKGRVWRANFYKCGNETSRPHWASWAPLSARNFHEPASFGRMAFCR
jgi:hypothetical protein